jgi:hypothetical protein
LSLIAFWTTSSCAWARQRPEITDRVSGSRSGVGSFNTEQTIWKFFVDSTLYYINSISEVGEETNFINITTSVADLGCLFQIPDPISSIPDPGSRVKKIPDLGSASKNINILNQTLSNLSEKRSGLFIPDADPGSGS